MDKNAAAQELKVKELAVDLQSWVAYDNLNRMQRVNEQIVGDQDKSLNITTSLIAKSDEMPAGGLTKDMIDYSKKMPLDLVPKSLAQDPHRKAVSMYWIFEAIDYVFYPEIQSMYKKKHLADADPKPTMPVIHKLKTQRTEVYSIRTSIKDEVSC